MSDIRGMLLEHKDGREVIVHDIDRATEQVRGVYVEQLVDKVYTNRQAVRNMNKQQRYRLSVNTGLVTQVDLRDIDMSTSSYY